MAVINLKIVVSNVEAVLAQFNRIKVYRSTTGVNGPYTELTDAGTRLVIESNKLVYNYTDTAGDEAYFYRSSYFNSVSALESSLSDPQQGEADPALSILSVDELKTNYLFGLDLTDDAGNPYPDSLFEFYIKSAVSWLELRLDILLRPTRILDERHDFYREDYSKYLWLETDHFPIVSVEAVRLVLPGQGTVQDFPQDWFQVEPEAGQVQLMPGLGSVGTVLLGATGSILPLFYASSKFIPGALRIDYTAGYAKTPPYLVDLVGKIASYGPLNIAGDLLVGAGIASVSLGIDGLSQSINTTSSATNSGYGARLVQYQKEVKDWIPQIEKRLKGMRMRVF